MNPRYRRLLIPGLLIALVVVVLVASLTGEAKAEVPPRGVVVSTIQDPRITESSGLAISRQHADLAYTINDSGHDPLVFAIEISTGRTVGTTTVDGVAWRDTEALAIDADGTLWVADTGDNLGARDDVALYSFDEPGPGDHRVGATRHPISYATGREDVEALLIDQATGARYLVSKGLFAGDLFALPDDLGTDPVKLEPVGVAMPGLATDGAITPDGRYALVRTYIAVHVYDVRNDFAAVSSTTLPPQEQGETLAVEAGGESYLIGSEGAGSQLLRLGFVADDPEAPAPTATPEPTDEADSGSPSDGGLPWLPIGLGAAGLVIVIVVVRRVTARTR